MTQPPAPVVALVPTRSPGAGKSRLAGRLDPRERAALGTAMLTDVITALSAAPVDRIVVAASGAAALRTARRLGVEVVADPPGTRGLDVAVAAAAERVPDPAALLVAMADLPCLSPADVVEFLASPADVVVAANDDGGTGGLLRRPGHRIPTAYGPGSAERHARLAVDEGRRVEVLHLPGFAFDVDTVEDLEVLRSRAGVGPATAQFLRALEPPGGTAAAG